MSRRFMRTYTGKKYSPVGPAPEDVDIQDIAHHLSNICRFNGACREFYSVAEHSVHVSRVVPPEYALQGLLHDAAEAYCADLHPMMKDSLANYRAIEARNMYAISKKFGLPMRLHPSVKAADLAVLVAESRALLPGACPLGIEPADIEIYMDPPRRARLMFLARFDELAKCA